MKNLFFLTLIFGLFPPINAESFCTLTSEEEPDVSITMNYPSNGYGYGTMNYKNEPEYFFDPDGQILFDINTGEVVASFVGEKRDFFFDEDAMILFDEGSGEILFSPDIKDN